MKKYMKTGVIAGAIALTTAVHAQSWQPCELTENSPATVSSSVVVHNGKVFEFHRIYSTNTLNVSTDNGETWTVVNSGWMTANSNSMGYQYATLASAGGRLYLFPTGGGCGEVLYSTDEGVTFQSTDMTNLPSCVSNGNNKAGLFYPYMWESWGNNHLIAIFEGADASYNHDLASGQWAPIPGLVANDPQDFSVRNDTLWAGSNGSQSTGVIWSVDGMNWNMPAGAGVDGYDIPWYIEWNNDRLFMYSDHYQQGHKLKYSDDFGDSFQDIDMTPFLSDVPDNHSVRDMFSFNGNLYLAMGTFWAPAGAPNLLVSTDNGQTFVADTAGLPRGTNGKLLEINYGAMVYNNGWLFAHLSNGDLYRKFIGDGTTGISTLKNGIALDIYPNPARETVTIANIPSGSTVNITELTGKTVYSAVSNSKNLTVNTSDFVNGIYIIHVENNGAATNSKLVISK